jgi:predicted nuclease of restriction endonuclease-like (RecB) superfamily
LVLLYWSIGRDILAKQGTEGWGTRVIDRLAHDLQNEFPGIEGFSPRSLKYMRALAEAWPEEPIVQQLIAQLPWGHNVRVLDRIKDRPTREWYLRAALERGWSQNVLVHMISGQLHEREGKALTNFKRNLPPPDSDMAQQILRDPYNFDFLTLAVASRIIWHTSELIIWRTSCESGVKRDWGRHIPRQYEALDASRISGERQERSCAPDNLNKNVPNN